MKRLLRIFMMLVLVGIVLALSGCSVPKLVLNPEDLYALPELPAKYTELNSQINAILESGAEYAAPTSGTNIQPVQLVDLDGDSRQEAIAFFRKPSDEKQLKIYIFNAEGDRYEQTNLIEGSGTGISSIAYEDMDKDGFMELIIGWKATAELQVLEIYRRSAEATQSLVRTNYVKYITADMDQDRREELVVLRADDEGGSIADYYSWQEDGSLASQQPARVSVTMAELSQQGRVSEGVLREEIPALFVTGVTDVPMAITDILALKNGELSNIVLSAQHGVSEEIAPFCGLYPTDINGDGLTEVPRPVLMEEQSNAGQIIEWYGYGEDGLAAAVMQTCHNTVDGWYYQLPLEWENRIRANRTTVSGDAIVMFYIRESGEPFLRISVYSGSSREIRAVQGNQFLLSRQPETLYTAELLEASEAWEYGVTADEVRAAFHLIMSDWTTGNN